MLLNSYVYLGQLEGGVSYPARYQGWGVPATERESVQQVEKGEWRY